jgi:hypothetical protein
MIGGADVNVVKGERGEREEAEEGRITSCFFLVCLLHMWRDE